MQNGVMVPLTPTAVAEVMDRIGVWWAVAGGWAIDLWLGEQTRDHHDIEVIIARADQPAVHAALRAEWDLRCIDPPGSGWRPWDGHPLAAPAFQLQANCGEETFDLFAETVEGTTWTFRRDPRITRPVAEVVAVSGSGIPVVRPEVQLLYMAKSNEPKHDHDRAVAMPALDAPAASWLDRALRAP